MQIDELIERVEAALRQDKAYAFLPDIRASLQQLQESRTPSEDERSHLAAGLERLVLEDYAFSESELGGELLAFSDRYVKRGLT